jgi:hypothetical protein
MALETALHHVRRNYIERDQKMIAAEELLSYNAFTAAQVAGWLALPEWTLEGRGNVQAWGISALTHEQLPMAVEMAKAGVVREKPKALILEAYKSDMSFNVIGGLLGHHKNVIRRIVRRLQDEPWT